MTAAALCLYQNEVEEAFKQTQSVYLRQPSNTMALYTLGYCQERMGHLAEALEFYQDCIKFKSHLQLPRLRMAAIYLQTGRLDKTLESMKCSPPNTLRDIRPCSAGQFISDGRSEQAADTFNLAILSHPDNFKDDCPNEENETNADEGCYDQALENILHMMEQLGLCRICMSIWRTFTVDSTTCRGHCSV